MKRSALLTVVLFFFWHTGNCQLLSSSDTLALKIPKQNTYATNEISAYVLAAYNTDSARIRALFVWVANNISYSLEKLRALNSLREITTTGETLKTRKGVCEDYANLFVELCNQCNIPAVFVPGYTKTQNGSLGDVAHAWVAARVGDKWFLFDPTWSAGSIDNGRFVKNFSNFYYKVPPEQMIKDHMPFDPMHQFLNYPVTSVEFNDRNTATNKSKQYFNYADSLKVYSSLSFIDQTRDAARRIQSIGVTNQHIRGVLEVHSKNLRIYNNKTGFDGAASQYKTAIAIFNRYIDNKNKRFSLIKEDREIEQMIDSVILSATTAKTMLAPLTAMDDNDQRSLDDIRSSITKFSQRVSDEKAFVRRYLQTDKALRKE